jgi:hypothetical protein
MLRHEVPVDDREHVITAGLGPVRVEMTDTLGRVEFWAEGSLDKPVNEPRTFRVFGTGHPLPDDSWWWCGTTSRQGGLVWHLYEKKATRR